MASLERQTLVLAPGSRLWIEGSSTLHRWSTQTTRLATRIETTWTGGPDLRDVALAHGVAGDIELRVPFSGLASGEGQLDEKLLGAVKADRFPDAVYRITGWQARPAGGALDLALQGTLAVAGVERPAGVAARLVVAGGGARLTGEHSLKMTDFGVKPPVLLFGALRTGDEVVVRWDVKLVPAR